MTFPITTTVTRLRAGQIVDRAGDTVESWDSPDVKAYTGVIYYPSPSLEALAAGQDQLLDGYSIHLPFGDDTTARDRFQVAALQGIWLVDGTPEAWPIKEPGWDYGTVVKLKRMG